MYEISNQWKEYVEKAADRLATQARIELTPGARTLLAVILQQIIEDPHPVWNKEIDTKAAAEDFARALPVILLRAAGDGYVPYSEFRPYRRWRRPERSKKRLSTFDLLHQMSWIVDELCWFKD